MKDDTLVSIIMPAYNVEAYIGLSIESVLQQVYKNWELIIVDDCSNDRTVEKVQNFLTDNRIRLIKNSRNLGGAGSRNKAIKAAKGRYIAFLDSDDLWIPEKLEKQVLFMLDRNIGFSFSAHTTIDEHGNILDVIDVPDKVDFRGLLKHNCIGCLTAMYDTEPHGKIYMPLVKKRQDFALWLELLKLFDYSYAYHESLGFYRIRSGSLSRSKSDAFKYYWRVLRRVGNCGYLSAAYNLSCYLFIVFLKKKYTALYHKLFIN
ncbi:glycosyltransferase family 2 protein [Pseudoalteromonas sp. McH1-7]|uniref:glycosyltransferase family 2 protein n=1 Tax=Pseudoalteromonas sp. McH1-7 TaxID=2745574 RepID=UPI00159043F4|nr:glycosyltransferase family 2 protein [Pseudoalteromonas sp. McH1-7]NUZ10657.1 glycosyltransferase family 2 protein [Pseudoalteromonas sp. McH1-7]